eukprot:2907865-Pyramimonas_sp.AAC.2
MFAASAASDPLGPPSPPSTARASPPAPSSPKVRPATNGGPLVATGAPRTSSRRRGRGGR